MPYWNTSRYYMLVWHHTVSILSAVGCQFWDVTLSLFNPLLQNSVHQNLISRMETLDSCNLHIQNLFFFKYFPPKLHRTCCSTLPSLSLSQNKDTNFAPWGWKVGFCACMTGQHLHSRSWLNRLEQKLWNTKTCYESMAKMETRQGRQFMNSPAWGGCCRRWKHWWSSSLGILAELWCFGILRLSETLYVPWARRCCWEGGWSVSFNMCKGCIITYYQSGKNDKLYQIASIMSEGPCESFSYLWTHRPVLPYRCFGEAVDQAKELAARWTIVMVMSWFALTKFQSKYAPLLGSTHTETMVSSRIVLFCSHKILQLLSHQRMKVDFQRCAYLPASTEPSSSN